jgi:2-keto-4-pentenoate hydratase
LIGWKVGFGSPEALERLGLERPLVAPLPEEGLLADGATVDVAAWTWPVLEAEVAVYAGRGLGVAIELADIDFPPDDVERIRAGGIYHRHVLLGPPQAHSLAGVTARVLRDGEEVAATDDLTGLTGSLELVLETVRLQAERELHHGELVIAGSVVPPQPIAPGEHWRVELLPLGALGLRVARV